MLVYTELILVYVGSCKLIETHPWICSWNQPVLRNACKAQSFMLTTACPLTGFEPMRPAILRLLHMLTTWPCCHYLIYNLFNIQFMFLSIQYKNWENLPPTPRKHNNLSQSIFFTTFTRPTFQFNHNTVHTEGWERKMA